MTTFVIDLFGLWAVMAVTAVALFGWGVLTYRLLGIELPRQVDTATVWLGVAVVLGAVELVHLFLPIDWKVSLVFAVIGIAAALKASDHSVEILELKHRIEVDVAATWRDLGVTLKRLAEDPAIRKTKTELQANPAGISLEDQMRVGVMVKQDFGYLCLAIHSRVV